MWKKKVNTKYTLTLFHVEAPAGRGGGAPFSWNFMKLSHPAEMDAASRAPNLGFPAPNLVPRYPGSNPSSPQSIQTYPRDGVTVEISPD